MFTTRREHLPWTSKMPPPQDFVMNDPECCCYLFYYFYQVFALNHPLSQFFKTLIILGVTGPK